MSSNLTRRSRTAAEIPDWVLDLREGWVDWCNDNGANPFAVLGWHRQRKQSQRREERHRALRAV